MIVATMNVSNKKMIFLFREKNENKGCMVFEFELTFCLLAIDFQWVVTISSCKINVKVQASGVSDSCSGYGKKG